MISQSEMHVEQFAKTADNKWILSEDDRENSILTLNSLQFKISFRDIYNKVEFNTEA